MNISPPNAQRDFSTQYEAGLWKWSRFLSIIQKAFIANPSQQWQVSRRKQPKTFKHSLCAAQA